MSSDIPTPAQTAVDAALLRELAENAVDADARNWFADREDQSPDGEVPTYEFWNVLTRAEGQERTLVADCYLKSAAHFIAGANPAVVLAILDALAAAERRIAELADFTHHTWRCRKMTGPDYDTTPCSCGLDALVAPPGTEGAGE